MNIGDFATGGDSNRSLPTPTSTSTTEASLESKKEKPKRPPPPAIAMPNIRVSLSRAAIIFSRSWSCHRRAISSRTVKHTALLTLLPRVRLSVVPRFAYLMLLRFISSADERKRLNYADKTFLALVA